MISLSFGLVNGWRKYFLVSISFPALLAIARSMGTQMPHDFETCFSHCKLEYQKENADMENRSHPGIRDELIIATKYTTCYTNYKGYENKIHSNYVGNGTKSLHLSLRDSLKKLQTDYIDILYLHWWDFTASIPEVMQALNTVVQQGKVLYLGVSDTPAWIVSKANQYARDHGLRQFVVYQGRWSAAERDFERDIVHMCAAENMGLVPWGSLGGGNFKTKKQREQLAGEGRNLPGSPYHEQVTEVLGKLAEAKGTAITSIALAYVLHKAPYVFPVVGGRKVEQLKGNIEALGLDLSEEDIKTIESAYSFDVGFPMNFLGGTGKPEDVWMTSAAGHVDHVQGQKPISAAKSSS